MHSEVLQMIFDQHQRRTMPFEVETAQNLQFHAFDIDGDIVELGVARFCEQVVQRPHIHFLHALDGNPIVQNQA